MAELTFDIEWMEPIGPEGAPWCIPEHEATWAGVRVEVGGVRITRFEDKHANSIRSTLVVPLYPLAEWIATHWWNLLYETRVQGRSNEEGYTHRHNLRYARSGFALPDLEITPVGDVIQLEWTATHLTHYGISFLESGKADLDHTTFAATLTGLLDSVHERLSQNNLHDTLFQEEWSAIREADQEESDFCRSAAKIGWYPYGLTDEQEQTILDIGQILPRSLYEPFFGVADADHLPEQAEQVAEILEAIRGLQRDAFRSSAPGPLVRFRKTHSAQGLRRAPWEVGYEWARQLRDYLRLDSKRFDSPRDLLDALHLNGSRKLIELVNSASLFDALVSGSDEGDPAFALNKHRDEAQSFALCRGVFEYLAGGEDEVFLVTREPTRRQQQNRAFAAEFLAPSSLLRRDVPDRYVDDEMLQDLADRYGVSTYVIGHQLRNHGIADPIDFDQ